jgi:hypothetical protein
MVQADLHIQARQSGAWSRTPAAPHAMGPARAAPRRALAIYSSRHGRRDLRKRPRRAGTLIFGVHARQRLPPATPTSCAGRSLHAGRRDIQENSTTFTTRPHSRQLIASPDRITAALAKVSKLASGGRPIPRPDSRHLLEGTLEHRLLSGASTPVDAMVAVLDAKSGFDAVGPATAISPRAYSASRLALRGSRQ